MIDNLKTIFTEEEAINITIQHGYDGAEFNTKAWNNNGSLKPDRTYKGFISKLETIYSTVKVEGKGKKRKYILMDKKEQITERQYNYKGSLPTPEDELMKEYIFNNLIKYHSNQYTYKGWAESLNFVNPQRLDTEKMINEIKYAHAGFPVIYNPKEVVSIFIQTLNVRNKDVIEKSFQRLEKENRIKLTEMHTFQYSDKKYDIVSKEEYEEIINELKLFLESKGITYYIYSQSLGSIHKSKKMEQLIKDVEEYLLDHFDIIKFFKRFKIEIIDSNIIQPVSKTEFNKAYFDRLLKLTQDRQQKEKYRDSLSFWRRYYLYNTLTLLRYIIGLENIDKLHRKSYLQYEEDKTTFSIQFDIDRENRRNSFGNS